MHLPPTIIRLAALSMLASIVAGSAAQDLRGTKHNLSGRRDLTARETGQICVFCHTPTFTGANLSSSTPEWQSSLSPDYSYPIFDDIGRMGTAGNTAVGSQSIACLSCHDSAQAFSVTRLSNDHPYGVPYRGAGMAEVRERARQAARASGAPMHEARRIIADEFRPAQRAVIDNRAVWWTSRTESTDRRGRHDLPLYVRLDLEDGSEIPFVECASCHNPHSTEALFLRASPDSGILCQTCHIK